jgi:acyl-CoA thioesterase-1
MAVGIDAESTCGNTVSALFIGTILPSVAVFIRITLVHHGDIALLEECAGSTSIRRTPLSLPARRDCVKSEHVVPQPSLQWAISHRIAVVGLLLALVFMQPIRAATVSAMDSQSHVVLVMGDSLSAAHGLAESQGWVALTAERLATSKPGWKIVNASISGETSAGGAERVVHELVLYRPAVLVIELGSNDALRGLPLRQMRINLARMIGAAQGIHAKVLLIGMRMPPNYGPTYTREFEQSFRAVARQLDVPLLPFLLEPIALDRNAFQDDNLHPVASAEPKLRDHVWQALAPLLK